MTATPPESQPASDWSAAPPQPAGPAAGVVYGGFWIRVLAALLDAIVLSVLTAAIAPLIGMGGVVETSTGAAGVEVNYRANALGTLIGLVYFVGFWSLRGQTVGMIPFRLRVVRVADGSRVDLVIGLLRYVGLIISFVALFLGVVWVAFDSRKQGWHDKIAGTLVVRDPA
jgi:uncharacterized RDD family membrane protein YckC